MTISLDVATALGSGSGNRSFSHGAGASPKGVVVLLTGNRGDGSRIASAVTYGGVAMSGDAGGNAMAAILSGTLEPGVAEAWFLGSGLPGGTQTVAITSSSGTYTARVFTVNASADTLVETFGGGAADGGSDFEVDFDTSPPAPDQEVLVVSGLHSSTNTVAGIGGFGMSNRVAVDLGNSCTGSGSTNAIQPAGAFTSNEFGGSFGGEHEFIVVCIGLLQAPAEPEAYWGIPLAA